MTALDQNPRIHCLVPDLPPPADVFPYLEEMAAARWYSNFGPINARFQDEITRFMVSHSLADERTQALTCSSATAGLELALRALKLPEKSEVLVPALTFPASALAVLSAGLTPVFCDVDNESWMLEPEIAEAALDSNVRVVMPVTTYGRPLPLERWQKFTENTGRTVIVDAAASLGQQDTRGELIFVFSLHATKPFGVGEGGLIVSGDQDLLAAAKSLSNFGFWGPAGVVQACGINAKMGEYYAANGLAQIERWPELFKRRKSVWNTYRRELRELGGKISLQEGAETFVPGTLMVRSEGLGQAAFDRFAASGVQTRRWYLPALYEHPALQKFAAPARTYPVSEQLKRDLIGLPFHGFLSENDVVDVVEILSEIVG